MRRRSILLALASVAACGRIGFTGDPGGPPDALDSPDAPGDASSAGPVTVSVTGSAGEPGQGQPIVDAYVVFVAGDGSTEIVRTDSQGNASGVVAGASTLHVAYLVEPMWWRVASFYEIAGDTDLRVGVLESFAVNASISITLPDVGALKYEVFGPSRCDIYGKSSAAVVTATYASRCDGDTVRLYAFADGDWLDVGTITLATGASKTAGGAWQSGVANDVQFSAVSDEPHSIGAVFGKAFGTDVVAVGMGEGSVVGGGSETLELVSTGVAPDRFAAWEEYANKAAGREVVSVPPAEVAGVRVAGGFLRTVDEILFDHPSRTSAWRYGAPTGTTEVVVAAFAGFEIANGDWIDWTAYAPAATTSWTLPALPAPLDAFVPNAGEVEVGVALTSVPGLAYRSTLGRVDRDFNHFLDGPSLASMLEDYAVSWRQTPKMK